jgi:hypothetical protein
MIAKQKNSIHLLFNLYYFLHNLNDIRYAMHLLSPRQARFLYFKLFFPLILACFYHINFFFIKLEINYSILDKLGQTANLIIYLNYRLGSIVFKKFLNF